MAKGFEDLSVLKQKSAGHALHVACGQPDEITIQPGHQQAVDTFAVEILAQLSVDQAESVIEFADGVGKTREIVEVIRREKFAGAVFSTEVHKRNARTFGFKLRTKFRELGDRLATEGSTKVAEEDQQERAADRKGINGFAGLRAVGLQEFGSDEF